MGKLSAITWLLVLLVLVPTGVLAWLGFQAADSFDAADRRRLERELAEGRTAVRAAVDAALDGVQADLQAAVDAAAARVARSGPDADMVAVAFWLGWEGRQVTYVTLLDANGRAIWPAEYLPDDAAGAEGDAAYASLLDHLRREADRAYYGEGGLAAAEAVWRDARTRFRTRNLRLLADVEAARLRVRQAGTGASALEALSRIREVWGPHELVPGELGRPILLLHLAAAPASLAVRRRLAAFVEEGPAALVPLTGEERARLEFLARGGAGSRDEARAGHARDVSVEAPVSHGARLRVTLDPARLVFEARRRLAHVRIPNMAFALVHHDPGLLLAHHRTLLDNGSLETNEVVLRGGDTALLAYAHAEYPEVTRRRQLRRLGLLGGVTGLFLLTLLGLFLTRRAVARERAANRLRDEFIANVTHEVRTPLTSVLLHSEMLAGAEGGRDADDARRHEHAEVVKAQGKRLARLVDDMLDFTALERGTRTLESAPVDLGAAAREAIAPFLVLAEREGVDAGWEVAGEEVPAMGDPAALARILGNLVGNAWKHGRPPREEGAGRIRVAAFEDETSDGPRPTIEVRDDGPGIPPAERETIFRRFGRGRGAGAKEGAGIGLALSRDLARAMGGDLEVREEDGETVFRLRLPPVPEMET